MEREAWKGIVQQTKTHKVSSATRRKRSIK